MNIIKLFVFHEKLKTILFFNEFSCDDQSQGPHCVALIDPIMARASA